MKHDNYEMIPGGSIVARALDDKGNFHVACYWDGRGGTSVRLRASGPRAALEAAKRILRLA